MSNDKLNIAFVRRGYSPSGGAEAYLKRLAQGIVDLGHEAQLVTTEEWPPNEWPSRSTTHLRSTSPIAFADELERVRPQLQCDVLMSLERVWQCDVYRVGDGVHRAWLNRRRKFEMPLQRFVRGVNRKHHDTLQLEASLLAKQGAGRVIANSEMVTKEIVDLVPLSAAARIFILPSIYDPFSNACLEALAAGLPVITTRDNGFSEIIENGVHGSIIDLANNVSALRDAIHLWSDESRRSSARSTISERASQFDISAN